MVSCFRLFAALYFGVALTNAFSSIQQFQTSPLSTLFSSPIKTQLDATEPKKTAIDFYLQDANYNQVMQSGKVVLVDCCAQWCGPCKLIDPFLVEASEKYSSALEIVKFDVEAKKNGGIKMEFLLQDVMPQALPSLILFRDGKALAKHTGALSKKDLFDFIETNMKAGTVAAQEESLIGAAASGNPDNISAGSAKGKINLGGMDKDDYML